MSSSVIMGLVTGFFVYLIYCMMVAQSHFRDVSNWLMLSDVIYEDELP